MYSVKVLYYIELFLVSIMPNLQTLHNVCLFCFCFLLFFYVFEVSSFGGCKIQNLGPELQYLLKVKQDLS